MYFRVCRIFFPCYFRRFWASARRYAGEDVGDTRYTRRDGEKRAVALWHRCPDKLSVGGGETGRFRIFWRLFLTFGCRVMSSVSFDDETIIIHYFKPNLKETLPPDDP